MFKQLKKSMIVDTMLMTAVILIVGIIILSAATYSHFKNETLYAMDAAIESVTVKTDKDGNLDAKLVQHGFANMYTGNVIVVVTDQKGNIQFVSSSIEVEDVTEVTRAVRYVVGNNINEGTVPTYNMRFKRSNVKNGQVIALADMTAETDNITFQVGLYMIAATLCMGIVYILAEYMANRAIEPLKNSVDEQSRFLADASHELKTPLTVILANMDIALSNPETTVEEQRKWLESTKSEARSMTDLVNDMLNLSRTDGDRAQEYMQFEVLNFSDLVDDCVLTSESLAFEKKVLIDSEIQEELYISGDKAKVRQVIMILLDNAVKYVNAGGDIKVTVKNVGRNVNLTVFNTGEAIVESKQRDIFERFFREEASRQKEDGGKGGFGLGLSIAKNIVDAHDGHIGLEYSDQAGTCFAVSFPGRIRNISSKNLEDQSIF